VKGYRLYAIVALVGCSHGRAGELPRRSAEDASGGREDDAAVVARESPPARPPEPEPEPEPRCENVDDLHVFTSPEVPNTRGPLRVVVVGDRPLVGTLRVGTAEGDVATSDVRHGGPPYFWLAEVAAPRAGAYSVAFEQRACADGVHVVTSKISMRRSAPASPPPPASGAWRATASWSHRLENVYSAWIEALFDAAEGDMKSWPALHEVLRDPKRNFLFDHLSAGEDSASAPVIRPDCADLPYFLRAYFAWKLHLPFGVAECNRGGGGAPPSCKGLLTNEDTTGKEQKTAVASFSAFLRGTLADRAHSGSARALMEDPSSDYYGVPLTWEALRPGTVYADPYGHVLMVAKKLPQTRDRGGVLIAVDGQPDGTVAHKRFWRGNFLYATDRELGGPGFKRFRPVIRQGGTLVRLDDDAIRRHPGYGDVASEPVRPGVEAFYDAMDDVLSPRPLDPARAMMETIVALDEQVRTRVKSVENGRKWLEKGEGPAAMPDGAEIFETLGSWEDFSTPSRDLRLLIAMDVVSGFPARVARRRERYASSSGDTEGQLASIVARELAGRTVTYTRSDGTPFTLTLAEVLARGDALEMGYNPNDCVELRWGAREGSDEARTCQKRAPADQRARMETYRGWFHERKRPARK
jgi:hypothetical protein